MAAKRKKATTKKPVDRPLTAKMEKFAQLWFSTGNKSEAYRRAYSTKNMSEAAINIEAVKMSKHPKIALRYDQLQAKAETKHQINHQKALSMLLHIYSKANKQDELTAMVSTMREIIKLNGLDPLTVARIKSLEATQNNVTGDVQDMEAYFRRFAEVLPN